MFVTVATSKSTGRKYVYLVESVRDPKTGKNTKKIVEKFGRLDELEKENPNFLAELKAKYDERGTRSYKPIQGSISQLEETNPLISDEELRKQYESGFNYGWLIFKWIWNYVLGLAPKLGYLNDLKYRYNKDSKGGDTGRFSMNVLASMLACRKAMGGASVLNTFTDRVQFLGMPKDHLSQVELYRLLPLLFKERDYLVSAVQKNLDKELGTDRYSLLLYDATNTYFEVSMTDEERGITMADYEDKVREIILQGIQEGELGLDRCIDEDGHVLFDKIPSDIMEDIDDMCIKHLRQHGPSKEKRTDLPLISIVLVIDKYGIPIDYAVYPGNKSEFQSMEPVITKMKERYQIKNAIVVADRGLNSARNLEMIEEQGLGYVVAQKITHLGKAYTDQLLDTEGYTNLHTEDGRELRYKVIDDFQKQSVDHRTVKPTLVITFDEKRKKRDDAIIDKNLAILEKKMKDKTKVKARKAAWAQMANISSGKDDGLILGVDDAAVAKKRALAGHAGFVFKSPPQTADSSSNVVIKPEDIVKIYAQLNRIERCFRIMKGNIGLRPVFLQKHEHIEAHVLLCFFALIMVCVLEKRLHDSGHMLSIEQMIKVLGDMRVYRSSTRKVLTSEEPVYDVVQWLNGSPETYTYIDPETHKASEQPLANAQFAILRVLGMDRLPRTLSKTTLAGCLRTKFRCPPGASICL